MESKATGVITAGGRRSRGAVDETSKLNNKTPKEPKQSESLGREDDHENPSESLGREDDDDDENPNHVRWSKSVPVVTISRNASWAGSGRYIKCEKSTQTNEAGESTFPRQKPVGMCVPV